MPESYAQYHGESAAYMTLNPWGTSEGVKDENGNPMDMDDQIIQNYPHLGNIKEEHRDLLAKHTLDSDDVDRMKETIPEYQKKAID